MVRTAQAAVVVGLVLTVARLTHGLGRSAGGRARLRRLVLGRAVPFAAVGLSAGAVVAFVVRRSWPQAMPRRYADYLPDDGSGTGTDPLPLSMLATLLIGGSVVLLAVWVWLRFARPHGRLTSVLRQGVPGVGGLLLLAGLVVDWIADLMAPASFGWFLYEPLYYKVDLSGTVDGEARALRGIAITLAALGLGVLTAVAAFRAGRKETTISPGERR